MARIKILALLNFADIVKASTDDIESLFGWESAGGSLELSQKVLELIDGGDSDQLMVQGMFIRARDLCLSNSEIYCLRQKRRLGVLSLRPWHICCWHLVAGRP